MVAGTWLEAMLADGVAVSGARWLFIVGLEGGEGVGDGGCG